jgi:hypothetical protein
VFLAGWLTNPSEDLEALLGMIAFFSGLPTVWIISGLEYVSLGPFQTGALVAGAVLVNWTVIGAFAEWYRRFPAYRLTRNRPVLMACVVSGLVFLVINSVMLVFERSSEAYGFVSLFLSMPSVGLVYGALYVGGAEDSVSLSISTGAGIALNWLLLGLVGEWLYRRRKREREAG